jgi:CRP-like cAMP-binding protein
VPSSRETIDANPLFASLDAKQRDAVAQDLREHRYATGDVITSHDTGGIAFFLLAEGTVSVTVHDVPRGTLGPGDSFGEIGLLTGAKRSAALIAESDVQCWTLSQWNFRPLLLRHPEFAVGLLEKLAHRVVSAERAASDAVGQG